MKILSEKYLNECTFCSSRYEALKKFPKNLIIAEVGVLAGDLSNWLYNNLQPKELHLIDMFGCEDSSQKRFKNHEQESYVYKKFEKEIINKEIIIKKGLSWEVLSTYPNHYFDIIYIDAGHDYNSVKNDLNASKKIIKENGYIMMNDYIMYDHIQNSRYGVVEATNEFCITNNWRLKYFAFHSQLFCDVVLEKIL